MFHMSEEKFQEEIEKARLKNESIARKKALCEIKNQYKQPRKKIQTSKMVLWAIIILVFQIVLFVEYAMVKWGDFSSSYALIGISATLIPVVWAYYSKSKAENTKGGITYDMAMYNLGSPYSGCEDDVEEDEDEEDE